VKSKLWVSPVGSVTLSTTMWPRFVFVKVQVFTSSAARVILSVVSPASNPFDPPLPKVAGLPVNRP